VSFQIWNKRDNLPLGIDRSTVYQHFEISIRAGDLLLLYTDAFVEGFNSDAKQLGEQGLLELGIFERLRGYATAIRSSDA
jgi:serine phosphatase RsbU (regulator of sigma subunit)